MKAKFPHGGIYFTRGVNDMVSEKDDFAMFANESLGRHLTGDWGDVCEEDRQSNEEALKDGSRLFSVYKREGLPTIWIITEADRSATTVLFPDEY